MAALTMVGLLGLCALVRADIYRYRDESGAVVFTNAPAAPEARMVIREPHLPPAPPILAVGPQGPGDVAGAYDPLIREIATRHGVEYSLVKAVIKAESAFDRLAISRAGALGLMQLMPATAAQHRVGNVFLPRDNIEGGCRHLRLLLDRYGGNVTLALAAYNAGTQRVEEAGGVPDIRETREYLARVLRYRVGYLREGSGVLASSR
ncbi:MAG: transglycosylase SLT domain-containing protein [Candidatus Binatia bacterium]